MFKKKENYDCEFEFTIVGVSNLPLETASRVQVQWKRGAKRSGQTIVKDRDPGAKALTSSAQLVSVSFGEKFRVSATVTRDSKGKWGHKPLLLTINEIRDKKANKVIGTVTCDLAEYLGSEVERAAQYAFKVGKIEAQLKTSIKARVGSQVFGPGEDATEMTFNGMDDDRTEMDGDEMSSRMVEENAMMGSTIQALESKVADLQAALKSKETAAAAVTSPTGPSAEQFAHLEEELMSTKTDNEALNQMLAEARSQSNKLESDKRELSRTVEDLRAKLTAGAQSSASAAQAEMARLEEDVAAAKEEAQRYKEEKRKLQVTISELESKLAAQTARLAELEAQARTQQQTLGKGQEELKALLAQSEAEKRTAMQQAEAGKKEADELKAQAEAHAKAARKAQQMQDRIEAYEAELCAAEEREKADKEKAASAKSEIESLKAKVNELESKASAEKQSLGKGQEELKAMLAQCETDKRNAAQLAETKSKEAEELRAQLQQAQQKAVQVSFRTPSADEVAEYRTKLAATEASLAAAAEKQKQLEEQLKSANAELSAAKAAAPKSGGGEGEQQQLREEIDRLNREHAAVMSAFESGDIHQLYAQKVAEYELFRDEAFAEVAQLEQEIENLREEVDRAMLDKHAAEEAAQSVTLQSKDVESRMQMLQRTMNVEAEEAANLRMKSANMQNALDELDRQNKALLKRLQETSEEADESDVVLVDESAAKDNIIGGLERANTELSKENEELKKEVRSLTDDIESLQQKIEGIREGQQILTISEAALRSELERKKADLEAREKAQQELLASNQDSISRLFQAEALAEERAREAREAQALVNECQKEVASLKAIIKDLRAGGAKGSDGGSLALFDEHEALKSKLKEAQTLAKEKEAQIGAVKEDAAKLSQDLAERYVLTEAVLHATPHYVETSPVPYSAFILFRCAQEWHSLSDVSPKNAATEFVFCRNIVRCIDHVIETSTSDKSTLLYMLTTCTHLMTLVRNHFPSESFDAPLPMPARTATLPSPPHPPITPLTAPTSAPASLFGQARLSLLKKSDAPAAAQPSIQQQMAPRVPTTTMAHATSSDAHELVLLSRSTRPLPSTPKSQGDVAAPAWFAEDDPSSKSPVVWFVRKLETLAVRAFEHVLVQLAKEIDDVAVHAVLETTSPDMTDAEPGSHVARVIDILTQSYDLMTTTHSFPEDLTNAIFSKLYYHMDAVLFNHLLARPSLCCMGLALQIKLSLTAIDEFSASNFSEHPPKLVYIRQAVDVLVVSKDLLKDKRTRGELCPALSPVQLRQILLMYHPDEFDADKVPDAVVRSLGDATGSLELPDSITLPSFLDLRLDASNWHDHKVSKTACLFLKFHAQQQQSNGDDVIVWS